jgi:hypothetical protein
MTVMLAETDSGSERTSLISREREHLEDDSKQDH